MITMLISIIMIITITIINPECSYPPSIKPMTITNVRGVIYNSYSHLGQNITSGEKL